MLGLSSPYLLITEENIPSVRGASQIYGLTYTLGTDREYSNYQRSRSVTNGFESIAGQINTELQKPLPMCPCLSIYLLHQWKVRNQFSFEQKNESQVEYRLVFTREPTTACHRSK